MKLGVLLNLSTEVPAGIKTVADFETVGIVIGDGKGFFTGHHLIIEGDQDQIEDWFVELGEVWVQKPGTPVQAQLFDLWEFK